METSELIAEIEPVDRADWEAWAPMTYPAYRRLPDTGRVWGLGATAFGQRLGLLLAQPHGADGLEVRSVFVVPAWRRRGLGTRLLAALEAAARRDGVRRLKLGYVQAHPGAVAVEKICQRLQWSAPRLHTLLVEASLERALPLRWLTPGALPDDFSIFPWSDLTESERTVLHAHEGRPGWHGPELSPFAGDPPEPETSVGLRHGGEVTGWMLTHRVTPGCLRYSKFFVSESCRNRGVALPLLAAAIRRHGGCSFRSAVPIGSFDVAPDNRAMLRMMQRRLSPCLISLKRSCEAEKLLEPPFPSVSS